jgi:hypothetical protein
MAIKRCPYCKAIIDEEDKYCNNCGTQLLFPEDESIEEEIPGDKIIDEEEEKEEEEEEEEEQEFQEEEGKGAGEEEDLSEAASGEEAEELGKGEAEEELEEEAELQGEETEEGIGEESEQLEEEFEEEEDTEEEEKEVSTEVEAEEWRLKETPAERFEGEEESTEADELQASGEIIEEKEEAEEEKEEAEEEEEEEEEIELLREEDKQSGEVQEPPAVRFEKTEGEKKYEISIEEDELVFKTRDLDQLTGTVEEGEKGLDEFLSSFKKAEEEKRTTPAALDELSEIFQEGKAAPGTREELPPWASGMKESPPTPVAAQPLTGTGDEASLTRREWTTDSGIGIPEKITQKTLPFADTAAQKLEAESLREEAPTSEEEKRRPSGLSSPLKARLVDVVFITALWLISLWFTAQVIGVPFFRLIFGSPIPVLAFYLILLVLYFFLFLYFLGETLGDHYFSGEDEDLHREE